MSAGVPLLKKCMGLQAELEEYLKGEYQFLDLESSGLISSKELLPCSTWKLSFSRPPKKGHKTKQK
jgi:hypothetical protein